MEQMEMDKRVKDGKLGAIQKNIEEIKFKTKQESYVQTRENDAQPESQDASTEIDCSVEMSKN